VRGQLGNECGAADGFRSEQPSAPGPSKIVWKSVEIERATTCNDDNDRSRVGSTSM
jgi:hypothetical protein